MAILIRAYRPADLDELIQLFTESVHQVVSRDYSPNQIAAWAPAAVNRDQWRTRLESRPTFVAEVASRIAGFSDLKPDGHIDMLFVGPVHQGRGVARRLLEHIETCARDQNIGRLFTEASITARPLFARWGFDLIVEQEVSLRGQTFTNFRMAKTLSSE